MKDITLSPGVGVGFKPQHFADIIAAAQPLGFFEVHAENYMGAGGPPHAQLSALRARYELSIHGVGLSLGGLAPPDPVHLARIKALCDRYQPEAFSEHLAWSSHDGVFFNDLLPLPYTRTTLGRVVSHVDQVQQALGRRIMIENPATYLAYAESTLAEADFIAELCHRADCGLLLDLGNVVISGVNHGLNQQDYLARLPLERVGEIHLAGHQYARDEHGAVLLIDTHDSPPPPSVRALYARIIEQIGPVPTLIEWDNAIPDWPTLLNEAAMAAPVLQCAARRRAA